MNQIKLAIYLLFSIEIHKPKFHAKIDITVCRYKWLL